MPPNIELPIAILLHLWLGGWIYLAGKKARVESAWLAFVPIGNGYVLCKAAGWSGWMILLYLLPMVPPFLYAAMWMETGSRLGLSRLVGATLFLPLPLVIVGIFLVSPGNAGGLVAMTALAGLIFLVVPAAVAGGGRSLDPPDEAPVPPSEKAEPEPATSVQPQGECVDGKREGAWTFFHPTGAKHLEGRFRGDQKQGLWTEWWPSGVKRAEGRYEDDRRQGEWDYFDHRGRLSKVVHYEAGEAVMAEGYPAAGMTGEERDASEEAPRLGDGV